jgi:serine O-acetyltransferase
MQALIEDAQPRFWPAVVSDARVAAGFRGERTTYRSELDAMGQVLRLCWTTEAFGSLVCYRARVSLMRRRVPVLPTVLHHVAVIWGQVSIGRYALLHPGVYLPHGQVVIDGLTEVRSGVALRPFVTLGLRDGEPLGPVIGVGARVGTGAKVFGHVRIGARAQIGANAVVLEDVPDDATAVGVPARLV